MFSNNRVKLDHLYLKVSLKLEPLIIMPLVVKRLRRKRRTIVKSRQKVTKKSFDLDEVLKSPELCNYHSSSGDVQVNYLTDLEI